MAKPTIATFLTILTTALSTQLAAPALAQSIMEAGGLHAGVAGLGAGWAASQNHGRVIRSTYEVASQTQQAVLAQNKAIEQYLKLGTKLESKKDWAGAEKCYAYVLQVVNRRDGPGSSSGLPALKHLVSVNVAQNKIPQAIGFQKTVVAFTERAKILDPQAILQSKLDLSKLFIKQNDYSSAEPYLQQSVAITQKETAIPRAQRKTTLRTYSMVLRKLKKTTDAEAIEATLAEQALEDGAVASKTPDKADSKPELGTKAEANPETKAEEKIQEKSATPAAEARPSAEIK
ncbi:MAG: hypothetical protein Q8T09_18650 [Candidatus Melainabacteria bacterium]|nr:hypothetical protein [Candidatus Melainabacteria bacterium]